MPENRHVLNKVLNVVAVKVFRGIRGAFRVARALRYWRAGCHADQE